MINGKFFYAFIPNKNGRGFLQERVAIDKREGVERESELTGVVYPDFDTAMNAVGELNRAPARSASRPAK